jgi:hypothetical protein
MQPASRLLLVAVALLISVPAEGQLPFSITLEASGGWAVPNGDLADESNGMAMGGGPRWSVGGRIAPISAVALFGGYQQTRFACGQCESLELEKTALLDGFTAGLHLSLPALAGSYAPWIRGSVIQQKLGFSGFGETLTSDVATGFSGSAGVAIPFRDYLQLAPSVSFFSVPSEFTFETLPARSIDVTAFTVDLGIWFSF